MCGWCQAARFGSMKSMALCCPLINKVFSAGWCRGGGLWGQAPHVIDVEFGWGLLKCVEALHFVVWGGNGLSPGCLLYRGVFVQSLSQKLFCT